MPRELAIAEVFFPTLLLLFIASGALQWGVTWVMGRLGISRFVWHPPLFRLCLFVIIFGCLSLQVYA